MNHVFVFCLIRMLLDMVLSLHVYVLNCVDGRTWNVML